MHISPCISESLHLILIRISDAILNKQRKKKSLNQTLNIKCTEKWQQTDSQTRTHFTFRTLQIQLSHYMLDLCRVSSSRQSSAH